MNNTLFWKSALVFCLILFGFSKWQTSNKAWAEYNDICSYSFGNSQSYTECMVFFETQKEYFLKIDYLVYLIALVSVVILAKNKFSKVEVETKKEIVKKKGVKKRARKS